MKRPRADTSRGFFFDGRSYGYSRLHYYSRLGVDNRRLIVSLPRMPGGMSQYRWRAERCRRLAKTAPNSVIAEIFEELAEQWLRVADSIEQVETYLAVRRALAHGLSVRRE